MDDYYAKVIDYIEDCKKKNIPCLFCDRFLLESKIKLNTTLERKLDYLKRKVNYFCIPNFSKGNLGDI